MQAIVFPGQGSQKVGMGKEIYDAFPSARDVFHEVDESLGENLTHLIFEGPDDQLTLTRNAQPALMAVSMAVMRVLVKEGGVDVRQFMCAAGHSLGEYSALAAIDVLSVSDTAKLLRIRGDAMQKAAPLGRGAMLAVLGLERSVVQDIAQKASMPEEVCVVANDNAPGQIVLSGAAAAIERAAALAKNEGAKRALPLPVSAPFHSPLMAPAAATMAKALSGVEFGMPAIPLVANVTARFTEDAAEMKNLLVEQVTGSVRWCESVQHMMEKGVETFIEIGAGKVLTGLNRRIAPEAVCLSLNTPEDIENFLKG